LFLCECEVDGWEAFIGYDMIVWLCMLISVLVFVVLMMLVVCFVLFGLLNFYMVNVVMVFFGMVIWCGLFLRVLIVRVGWYYLLEVIWRVWVNGWVWLECLGVGVV